jgi:signal transduction histidine kinase
MTQSLRRDATSTFVTTAVHVPADLCFTESTTLRARSGSRSRLMQRRPERSISTLRDRALPDLDLLSLLAHEIMSPLTLIDASAQRMIRHAGEMDTAEIELRASRIRAATTRLATLVRSLIDRAKLDSGSSVQWQTCDLATVLDHACDLIRQLQPSRNFKMDLRKAGKFRGDPLLLEQLFAILVSNAAKYSPAEAPIEITAKVERHGVTVSVTDHGIGIPENDLGRLFEPYFRAANVTGYHGAGLGLSLARRIAQLHGGTVRVQSRHQIGSTFTLFMPAHEERRSG